ncbi:MAG: polyphosphate:AMP phosphotransferase [Burkholderiaceae bacterium]|nr:polyphosphate:AMP phosphotransferase [Burkholderiaceae bacterium]
MTRLPTPRFDIAETDPALPKEAYRAREQVLRTALLQAQYRLLERHDGALLIVVAGIDGAGKGATINLLNEWMDPRHIQTLAFDRPTVAERARPPMWRYWNAMPARGKVGVVFGSWYALLLQETARKRVRLKRVEALAESIRRFEAMIAAEGVQLLKLWFHLSADAQAQRLDKLLASPRTAWQVTPADYKVKKKYDRLSQAGHATLELTDVPHALWQVVPSADDRLRAVVTADAVLAALRRRSPVPVASRLPVLRDGMPDRLNAAQPAPETSQDLDVQIALWQGRLAQAVRSKGFESRGMVLAFEGQDAAGKGGAIRRIVNALDARQYDIHQISAPTPDELAHPYLWRFWRRLPRHGRVGIFDRSWYGRVLVERVEGFAKPAEWRRAYAEINDFERQLTTNGVLVLKFWLSVTSEEQLVRFKQREHSPFKRFKITPEDWRNRDRWNDYARAANEMFARCDTPQAPWHVVPANDKRRARLTVLQHVVRALEEALDE